MTLGRTEESDGGHRRFGRIAAVLTISGVALLLLAKGSLLSAPTSRATTSGTGETTDDPTPSVIAMPAMKFVPTPYRATCSVDGGLVYRVVYDGLATWRASVVAGSASSSAPTEYYVRGNHRLEWLPGMRMAKVVDADVMLPPEIGSDLNLDQMDTRSRLETWSLPHTFAHREIERLIESGDIVVDGRETRDGRPTWRLKLRSQHGGDPILVWLDERSGTRVRFQMVRYPGWACHDIEWGADLSADALREPEVPVDATTRTVEVREERSSAEPSVPGMSVMTAQVTTTFEVNGLSQQAGPVIVRVLSDVREGGAPVVAVESDGAEWPFKGLSKIRDEASEQIEESESHDTTRDSTTAFVEGFDVTFWRHGATELVVIDLAGDGRSSVVATSIAQALRNRNEDDLASNSVRGRRQQRPGPTLATVGQFGQDTWAVESDADRVYAGFGPRIAVLDVSNPPAPVELGAFVGQNPVRSIAVARPRLYTLDSVGTVQTLDITNPASPQAGDHIVTPVGDGAVGLYVNGDYLYLGESPDDLYIPSGLRVFHVSTLTQTTEVALVMEPEFKVGQIAFHDTIAYVALWSVDRKGEVRVVDISQPADPFQIAAYVGDGGVGPIALDGNTVIAFVYDTLARQSRLEFIDMTNPAEPVRMGSYTLPATAVTGGDPAFVADIAVGSNSEAFTVEVRPVPYSVDMSGEHYILRMFDVANPGSPAMLAEVRLGFRPYELAVLGDYLFIAGGESGLHVVAINR